MSWSLIYCVCVLSLFLVHCISISSLIKFLKESSVNPVVGDPLQLFHFSELLLELDF